MLIAVSVFAISLMGLLFSAKFFTQAAEQIGVFLRLPPFVIGVFIIGIGTSLPELVSGVLSVQQGVSEIVPGNISGANISNLLLLTGVAVILNRKSVELSSGYIYIDLHFLLGGAFSFYIICADGKINFLEACFGGLIFLVYSIYLIKQGSGEGEEGLQPLERSKLPWIPIIVLFASGIGIYFAADYTVSSLTKIADGLKIPKSIAALTILSLGTTLPELAVIAASVKQQKVELAIGNVLGSAVFNSLAIPFFVSAFGRIDVPPSLGTFTLPVLAASSVLFYLLTQDKKISVWEGWVFLLLYALFFAKIAGL